MSVIVYGHKYQTYIVVVQVLLDDLDLTYCSRGVAGVKFDKYRRGIPQRH